MNNNNAKKKGGDGDTTKSTQSSDTEESLSIDEEDVEFVTKNALFTKRLLANSKELEEEKKGKNEKNKSHGDAKNDEDNDDDDNVERMFFEQEKAKKKEAREKKQREILKKKKMKEENIPNSLKPWLCVFECMQHYFSHQHSLRVSAKSLSFVLLLPPSAESTSPGWRGLALRSARRGTSPSPPQRQPCIFS